MSDSKPPRLALTLGLIALAAIPVGVLAAQFLKGLELVPAVEVAVPVAFVAGLGAVSAARRARFRLDQTVRRTGAKAVRIARFVAWAGLYVACSGGIALGFYGLLVLRGG